MTFYSWKFNTSVILFICFINVLLITNCTMLQTLPEHDCFNKSIGSFILSGWTKRTNVWFIEIVHVYLDANFYIENGIHSWQNELIILIRTRRYEWT